MRTALRKRIVRKLASLFVVGAAICQTGACTMNGDSLAAQWLTSVTTIWLQSYFANQFNVTSTGF